MKRIIFMASVLFASGFLLFSGCGRKGAPFLPEERHLPGVVNLNGGWENGSLVLRGKISPSEEVSATGSNTLGCRLYHTRYDIENSPCDGCPVDYPDYLEINETVIRAKEFFCQVPMPKEKGVHFFMVRLVDKNDMAGPRSNRLKVIVD